MGQFTVTRGGFAHRVDVVGVISVDRAATVAASLT
jgi:hypothetical protein